MLNVNRPQKRGPAPFLAAAAMSVVTCVAATAVVRAADSPMAPNAAAGAATSAVSAVAASALVGRTAPDFTLPDQNDAPHSLKEARGKWVVLAFYPKDQTRGCTLQNKSYTASKDQFAPLNATFYTVSTQDTASKRAFCAKYGLTHTLLADVGGNVAQQYGVYVPGAGIARRVTFYIRPDGTVAAVDDHIQVATAADDSLSRLRTLESSLAIAQTIAAVSAAAPNEPPRPGDRIADFTLPLAATGQPKALADLEHGARGVALIFVSTQCPVSKAYNRRMEQLAADYAAKGVRLVGIDSNHMESSDNIVRYAAANGLTFPILRDDGNRIADRLDAQVTPEVYLIDASGVLLYHGPIDDDRDGVNITQRYLRDALDATLADRQVAVKTARAFGCSIKRVATAS